MPGQYYSDKYIKHQRGAEHAENHMMQAKAKEEELLSEEREQERRFHKEQREEEQRAPE